MGIQVIPAPPILLIDLGPPDATTGEFLAMAEVNVMQPLAAVQAERPLCVDLDGTLVKSDTLVDSLMVLARRQPTAVLRAPLWAMQGKAQLKSQVTSRVALDVEHQLLVVVQVVCGHCAMNALAEQAIVTRRYKGRNQLALPG